MSAAEVPASGRVLVVDDEPRNRELLRDVLEAHGFEVSEAADGMEALALVDATTPDVVLLDVAMPGMDGLTVCRRLKEQPATAAIPVIMVTAHADRRDRLDGIRAGANDYVTKPVDVTDLSLRVGNAVALKRLHGEVADQLHRLQELERLRDALTHMVIHDLRSPLSGIMLALDLIGMTAGGPGSSVSEDVALAQRSARAMSEMIAGLLDISRLESGEMPLERSRVSLAEVAAEAKALAAGVGDGAVVRVEAPSAPVVADADRDVIRRVLTNLVGNALKFTPEGGHVRVAVSGDAGEARVEVVDHGPGIAPEYHGMIFEKFGQVRDRKARLGTGLGLAFCKLAVEAHGGQIGVRSEVGRGSTFWVTLPRAEG